MEITREQRESWSSRIENSRFKAWIDPHIRHDGRLSPERLYAFARKHGVKVDEPDYASLNPGQIRRSIGNKICAVYRSTATKPWDHTSE